MTVFSTESFADHEQVIFVSDDQVGPGPSSPTFTAPGSGRYGGCRLYPYADEASALRDVLRLSRGMTFKAAAADSARAVESPVILGDPRKSKTPELRGR